MMTKASLLAAALLASIPAPALADGARPGCKALAAIKKDMGDKIRWSALTPGQFHFAQGAYVLAPMTPPGLPHGDKAVLVQKEGEKDGVIFFIAGPLACAALPAPEILIKMMGAIKTGALDGEGDEL